MRKRNEPTLMESVGRGAMAGLIGGAALVLARRVLLPRLPDRKRPRVDPWDKRISAVAERAGLDVTPRGRTALGMGTQIAAAVALGAAYTVIIEQGKPSRQVERLVDAGLVYAASLFAPDLARKRPPRRRKARLVGKVLDPITAPAVFGGATTLALKAFAR